MKALFRRLVLLSSFTILPLFTAILFGDPPGPPGPGGDPSGGGTPVGGPVGGPVGDGVGILLTLALVYGCYKLYEVWRTRKAQRELY